MIVLPDGSRGLPGHFRGIPDNVLAVPGGDDLEVTWEIFIFRADSRLVDSDSPNLG